MKKGKKKANAPDIVPEVKTSVEEQASEEEKTSGKEKTTVEENASEEEQTSLEEQRSEEEDKAAEETARNDQRSLTLWLVAGAFLAYTGYQLCKGYVLKDEGSALGFFAIGAAFIGFGAFLVVKATKGLARADRVKKARMQSDDTDRKQKQAEKMSIAQRARLARILQESSDASAEETQENTPETDAAQTDKE